jgi:hypothetical protein
MVTIGKKGGDVYIGDVGSASNLVFEESSTIHGQGGNTLTFGQTGDKINFAVNIGIGSSTPTYPISHSSGAYLSVGGTWTNASDVNLKENFTAIDSGAILDGIKNLPITQWNYIVEGSSTPHLGPMAQDFYAAFGLGESETTISTIDEGGIALAGVQELAKRFDVFAIASTTATSSHSALAIDVNGNIGIGTTTPAYKLQVVGDVAAASFVNTSTRSLKTNINYLDESREDEALAAIDTLQLATYDYTFESHTIAPKHLGLIAEEAPSEVLSQDGKGVDIYKLATFTLAGVKAQQRQIENLDVRVGALEEWIAAAETKEGGLVALASDWLQGIGITLSETLSSFNNLAAAAFTVGSAEKPNGITLFDEETGEAFCVKIKGGAMVHEQGSCEEIALRGEHAAPTIEVQGNNPALVTLNATYSDLGVIARDWEGRDLTVHFFVNGTSTPSIVLDTSTSTTYIIEYSVRDMHGLSATSTRTVVVGDGSEATTPLASEGGTGADTTSGGTSSAGGEEGTASTTPETAGGAGDGTTVTDGGPSAADAGGSGTVI